MIHYLDFEVVFEDVSAGNPRTQKSKYLESGLYPIIDQGKQEIAGFSNDPSILVRANLPLIVFGDHTMVFKLAEKPFGIGADGVKLLKPKINANIRYLYYYLKSVQLPDTGYDRHYKFLKRIEVPLPPLAEQRRIAAIFDKVDELRSLRRRALARLDDLVQSVFFEMFGDPEENNKGWTTTKLGNICRTTSGGTPSRDKPEFYTGSIPWLKSGELKDNFISMSQEHISEAALQQSSAKVFPKGSVLIALYGATAGKLGILDIEAATNQAICALFPSSELSNVFLFSLMLYSRNQLLAKRLGGAQPNISQQTLRNWPVFVPPIEIQLEYERFFFRLHEQKSLLRKSGNLLEQLSISASNTYLGNV